MPIGTHNRLLHRNNLRSIEESTGKIVSDDFYFIKKHWKYLGTSDVVGGFKLNNKHGEHIFEIFACEFVTDDNKCSIHKNNPKVCSRYPWYDNKTRYIERSMPWPYKGCGYERISIESCLLRALVEIKKKKMPIICEDKNNEGNCKREISLSMIKENKNKK